MQFTERIPNNWENGYWAGSWASGDDLYSSFGMGKNYYGNDNYCGIRFPNVSIPKGSTITSAYLKLTDEETKSCTVHAKIFGIDEDNTADFHSDPIGRSKTSASVDWDQVNQVVNTERTSADIKAIIQEIIDRAGWSSGNSIGFISQDDGTSNDNILRFWSYYGASAKAPYLEINYSPPSNLITKDLSYKVRRSMPVITKLLRYCITDQELLPVVFNGIKISKDGHDVRNTKNPNNLKISSDYNTLKYFLNDTHQIHVSEDEYTLYNVTGYIEHNLGYFPFAEVYVKDDLMSAYNPLGRFQAGSGASRSYFFYVTTTRLYFIINGWTGSSAVDFDADFYYKIFKNNLGL